ncbi:MAG: hypothetical protein HOP07_02365 [Bacteriovoracaceae bacterium]|nr:hypothetical protein [Bacteriovoracaceae bacterium]
MKTLITTLFCLGMNLTANAATCYEATAKTPSNIPQTFCFDSLSLNLDANLLEVSGSDTQLPKNLSASITRSREDRFSFKAKNMFFDFNETMCGESIQAFLLISGRSNEYGEVETSFVDVSVNYEITNDNCHSHPNVETFTYKLVK